MGELNEENEHDYRRVAILVNMSINNTTVKWL